MSNWFCYDWYRRSKPIKICADLSFEGGADAASLPVLVRVAVAAGEKRGLFGGPVDERRIRKMADKLGLAYVGRVAAADETEHFLYGPEGTEPLEVEAKLGRGGEAICRPDPGWDAYYTTLFPDAAKYQTVRNREFSQKLYQLGDDPASPRRVSFHCHFPREADGLAFAGQALEKGFAVGATRFEPARELPYEVVLHRVSDIAAKNIDALTTRAIRLAQEQGGELSGWDCPVIPRGKVFR